MILDWKADNAHAQQYEILDADTFQPLPMEPPWDSVFYADDSRALLRYHKRDANGRAYLVYAGTDTPVAGDDLWARHEVVNGEIRDVTPDVEAAWAEVHRRIRIVRKADAQAS